MQVLAQECVADLQFHHENTVGSYSTLDFMIVAYFELLSHVVKAGVQNPEHINENTYEKNMFMFSGMLQQRMLQPYCASIESGGLA